jgi:hypothetical protein
MPALTHCSTLSVQDELMRHVSNWKFLGQYRAATRCFPLSFAANPGTWAGDPLNKTQPFLSTLYTSLNRYCSITLYQPP